MDSEERNNRTGRVLLYVLLAALVLALVFVIMLGKKNASIKNDLKALEAEKEMQRIDFQYEVSFYFIDDKFEYALYAPDKSKRWILKEYNCTDEDIAFAGRFIEWNTVTHGIQRVDACRTQDDQLLLVELEDLNPYLSILGLFLAANFLK